mmetsp:Transcript_9878/g.20597  ORF Transcript_9878/g.20597 Transcript_9878/m.20597 type:complete len:494 (+) Transcript_9878:2307-3788(+)
MRGAQQLLLHFVRRLELLLRVGVLLLLVHRHPQVAVCGGHELVLLAQVAAADVDPALQQRDAVVHAPQLHVHVAQVHQQRRQVQVVRSQRLLADGNGLVKVRQRLGELRLPLERHAEVVQQCAHGGVLAQVLVNGHRLAVQGLRLRVLAQLGVSAGEVVHGVGHVGVVRPKVLQAQLERVLEEVRRLCVPIQLLHQRAQVVQVRRHVQVLRAEHLLVDVERLAVQVFRLVQLAHLHVQAGQVGQGGGHRRVRRAIPLLADLESVQIQLLGVVSDAELHEQPPQVAARGGYLGVHEVVRVQRLLHAHGAVEQRLRLLELSADLEHLAVARERLGHLLVVPLVPVHQVADRALVHRLRLAELPRLPVNVRQVRPRLVGLRGVRSVHILPELEGLLHDGQRLPGAPHVHEDGGETLEHLGHVHLLPLTAVLLGLGHDHVRQPLLLLFLGGDEDLLGVLATPHLLQGDTAELGTLLQLLGVEEGLQLGGVGLVQRQA